MNNLKTPHHLTLTYGRKTPIMTTRIHPGTKLMSENVRKVTEVKTNNNVGTVVEFSGLYFLRHLKNTHFENIQLQTGCIDLILEPYLHKTSFLFLVKNSFS